MRITLVLTFPILFKTMNSTQKRQAIHNISTILEQMNEYKEFFICDISSTLFTIEIKDLPGL